MLPTSEETNSHNEYLKSLPSKKFLAAISFALWMVYSMVRLEDINVNIIQNDVSNRRLNSHQQPKRIDYSDIIKAFPLDTNFFPRGENAEKIVPLDQRKPDDEIRYASFGTSKSFAARTPNPNTDAFVKLLSQENGDNYALRGSGPNYPAACTYSMLGDNEYDVFILEYFRSVQFEGMRELAQTLRERFPDSIIIILRMWEPQNLFHKHEKIEMSTFAKSKGFEKDYIHHQEFHDLFLELGEDNWEWEFEAKFKHWVDFQEDVAKEVGAYIIEQPLPKEAGGPLGYLEIGNKYFSIDSFHPSVLAHQDIKNRVKALVNRVGVPKQRRVRPFSNIDYCFNWFYSGVIDKAITLSDSAVVEIMPNTDKYGLSFKGGEGDFEVRNPSNEVMYLSIAHMSKTPEKKYPRTEISSGDKKLILNPHDEDWFYSVHITKYVYFGEVQPQQTLKLHVKELEESEWPFRIVQIVMTPKEDFATFGGQLQWT